jgi:competence protein ComEC
VTPVGTIAVASPAIMALLTILAVWLSSRAVRDRRDVVAWLALCAAWTIARDPPPVGALRVTFVDVGQGDAAIVELPDGAVWLVDAGGLPNGRDPSAPGRTVDRVLAAYGHARVDLAILSHPHPDHYLGFAGMQTPIAEHWAARELEKPGQFAAWTHPPLGAIHHGDVELDVLAPRYTDGTEAADPVRSVNDNSLVIAIRYRGRSIVFAGDLEGEGEDALVAGGLGHVDVVKVPHHGSPTSSTAAFVTATHPALAVISCGRGNHFGFPSREVIARWRAAGAEVARTDEDGAVTVTIDAGGGLAVDRFVRK